MPYSRMAGQCNNQLGGCIPLRIGLRAPPLISRTLLIHANQPLNSDEDRLYKIAKSFKLHPLHALLYVRA